MIEKLKEELRNDLFENILPYWETKMADPAGGFYGRRDGYDRLHPDAPKGAILNARILWTFAAAFGIGGDNRWLKVAQRARDYILDHFVDPDYGGVYWSVDSQGRPLDTKKQFYAIAFAIYGLAELARHTSDTKSAEAARRLFDAIETHSRDRRLNGYVEAATRDWRPIADMRLSDKDENAALTMNTHLHILEAYTNLLRLHPGDEAVREATANLIGIFLDKIIDGATGHLGLFFDNDWRPTDAAVSYGHDIEASWLLLEAAMVVGDSELTARTLEATGRMARAALEGIRPDGSMVYELHADGTLDAERHWWVQAEAVVGQLYLALYHKESPALEGAGLTWNYIKENLIDEAAGEWFWSRGADGAVNRRDDHAGFWKCPYHNGRMAMEACRVLELL